MKPLRPVEDEDPHEVRDLFVAIALGLGIGAMVLFIATRLGGALGG